MHFVFMCTCAHLYEFENNVCADAYPCQRASDSLKLELQTVVIHLR